MPLGLVKGVIEEITTEPHRVVIHVKGTSKDYEVIATLEEAKTNNLGVGDDIEYVRESGNFGRFKAKTRYQLHH
jgi:hypothetical protein